MTATPSQSKLRPFWLNARTRIIANRKPLIVYSALQLLGLPLVTLAAVLACAEQLKPDLTEEEGYWIQYGGMYALLGAIFFIISLLLGFLFATGCFDYLFRKAKVDMTFALPINTSQRFFSDFLTGAALYLVPFLLACGLCYGIFETGCLVQDGMREFFRSELFTYNVELIAAKCILMVALGMLCLYACTVFAMTCCGTPAESLSSVIGVLFLVPITIVIFGTVYLQNNMYGIDLESILLKLMEYTGPVGACSVFFSFMEAGTDYPIGSWAIAYLAEILLLVAVTYLLYRHRKAEDTSKPYVYKAMYYLFMTALMVCLYAIAVGEDDTLVPVIIFSAVVYLISEIITNRGFKKFYKSILRFAVTMGAVAGFTGLLNATDYFGVVNRIPEVSNISSISFSTNENYNTIYWPGNLDACPEVKLTEPAAIEAVRSLHQELLDEYIEPDDGCILYFEPVEIRITYHLKVGGQFTRRYNIPSIQWETLVEPVMRTDAWMQATLDLRLNDNDERTSFMVENDLRDGSISFTPGSAHHFRTDFKQAYMQDWKEMTDSEFLEPKQIYLYLEGIPVRSSFERTMQVLKSYKCTPPTPYHNTESSEYVNSSGTLFMLDSSRERNYHNFANQYGETITGLVDATPLLPYGVSYGSTTGKYALHYQGCTLFLSPEGEALAEKLIAELPETPDMPKPDEELIEIMFQYETLNDYYLSEYDTSDPDAWEKASNFWNAYH